MKISYAITVCNEIEEIQRLVNTLNEHKREEDEIVILFDNKNGSWDVEQYLTSIAGDIKVLSSAFENHFADWKNYLTGYCTGDYIFQIDADEYPSEDLIQNLPEMLELNPEMDIFLVPRVNTVEGLTPEHIAKWGWNVTDTGWVNWPDFQWRIWRNVPEIKWINKVHERLDGFKTYTLLPDVEYFALHHPKTIERQEKQNNYYDTL